MEEKCNLRILVNWCQSTRNGHY